MHDTEADVELPHEVHAVATEAASEVASAAAEEAAVPAVFWVGMEAHAPLRWPAEAVMAVDGVVEWAVEAAGVAAAEEEGRRDWLRGSRLSSRAYPRRPRNDRSQTRRPSCGQSSPLAGTQGGWWGGEREGGTQRKI